MRRRNMSTTRRAQIFRNASGICHICGSAIDGTRDAWDADHVIPLEIGGDDTDANLRPAHARCHRDKTSGQDIPQIAKAKRIAAKHNGAKKPTGQISGSKASRYKRKLDGTVVLRKP